MKTKSSPVKRLGVTTTLLTVAALVGSLFALSTATAAPTAINPFGNATCPASDPDCVAAISLTGRARCENATCVAISVTGDADAGCYSERCASCPAGDHSCGITPCEGDLAFTCVTVGLSGTGESSAYTYCHWWLQSCYAIHASIWGTGVYYCYGDLTGFDEAYCQGSPA